MKHFQVLFKVPEQQIDVVNSELDSNTDLWNAFPVVPNSVIFQWPNITKPDEQLETISYPAMLQLPACMKHIFGLMSTMRGERLGRAFVMDIPPMQSYEGKDAYADYYARYHFALKDNANTIYNINGEYFAPDVGDVFRVHNDYKYTIWNDSPTETLRTFVVDIKKPVLFTGEYVAPEDKPKRKRGRPRGSKNKKAPQ